MKYKAVLRVEPLKPGDLNRVEKHQNRDNNELHINKDKTQYNKIIYGSENLKDDINNIVNKYKHHPRASICAELILTANVDYFDKICPEWRKGKINDKLQKWIDVNTEFLKEKYPGVAGIRLHLDEQTPHLHAYVVPISTYNIKYRRGEKQVTKVKYNNVFGDDVKVILESRKTNNPELTKTGKLQTDYANYLKNHGIDLERGTRNSRQKHKSIREYHKQIARELPKFPIEKLILKERIGPNGFEIDKDMDKKIKYIYNMITQNNSLQRLKKEMNIMKKENDRLKEELTKISIKYEEISKEQLARNRKISLEEMADFLGYQESLLNEKGKYKWRNAIDMLIDLGKVSPKDAMLIVSQQDIWNIDKVKNTITEKMENTANNIINSKEKPALNYFQKQSIELAKSQLIGLGGNEGTRFRITLMHKDKPTFNLGKNKDKPETFYNINEVLDKVPYLLKMNNIEKYNIFITPFSDKYDFYLIDDMTKENIENMENDGLKINVLATSSPGNFQGILLHNKDDLPHKTKNIIFKNLNYSHGDQNIGGQIHPFRLCGFHNVKPKHEKNGKYPVVQLIRQPIRAISDAFRAFVDRFREVQGMTLPEKNTSPSTVNVGVVRAMPETEGHTIARKMYNRLQAQYGNMYDGSRGDFMTIQELIRCGFSDEKITQIIESESPGIHERHKNEVDKYIKLTLSKFSRNEEKTPKPPGM